MFKNSIVTVSFILIAAAAQAQSEISKIVKTSAHFSKDYVEGNIEGVANAYAIDGILMAPGKEIIVGRKAIYDFWMSLPKSKLLAHRTKSDTIIIKRNEAHDYGYGFVTLKPENPNDTPKEQSLFKYYILWEKDKQGNWKMKMDVWNTRDSNWKK